MSHRHHGVLSGGGNRSRPSAAPSRRDNVTPSAPPPYEPLAHPLTAVAQRELGALAGTRDTRKYEQLLARCATELRSSVGAVNDRLGQRRQEAAAAAKRRRDADENGNPTTASQASVTGQALQELESDVAELTSQLEAAAREVIDLQAGLQDELASLAAVKMQVGQMPRPQRRRRREVNVDHDEDEDEDQDEALPDVTDEIPVIKARDLLDQQRAERAKEYADLDMYTKYARNNDYIAFKKMLQDARDPDSQVPDPSTWFDEDGEPVLGPIKNEDAEELEVVGIKQDYRCPLTQAPLVKPLTSRICQHTFEKDVILEFVQSQGPKVHCPQTGCTAVSTLAICVYEPRAMT
jgi:hypothetical protein